MDAQPLDMNSLDVNSLDLNSLDVKSLGARRCSGALSVVGRSVLGSGGRLPGLAGRSAVLRQGTLSKHMRGSP
ncbi:hypothetical protein [Streptomyces sp. NPDC055506]